MEKRLNLPRFATAESLLELSPDVVFIHTLDVDVPHHARLAAAHNPRGLFLEKPGACTPDELFKLADDLSHRDIAVEFGWEMHYAEVMDVVRDLVRNRTLGQITTSHWHGGCPSGAGDELWQRQATNLGGFVYEDGCHTLEAIVDVFGCPRSVVASIRKLPNPTGEKHGIVSCFYDMHEGELDPGSTEMAVGSLMYEDIGSVILEYEGNNVVVDFTAWEPTDWCEDWGISLYGTNGTFHGVLNPPKGEVMLREARGGYAKGVTRISTEKEVGVSNQIGYYEKQIELFLKRAMQRVETEKSGWEIEVALMKVLKAVYVSARERRFVDVEAC